VYHRPDGSTEKSRQGLCFTVGKGKVFYFQPGHETYPHFFDENVRKILRNAVEWAAPK
jgi:trehalose utilization protein